MNVVDRVQKMCLSPDTEWPVVASESAPLGTLISGYVVPVAAVSAIGAFLGAAMAGRGLTAWLAALVTSLVMSVAGVVVLSLVIDNLATTFGAERSADRAGKVAAYAPTAAWVAGAAQFVPLVGGLLALVGALYSIYILYLGLGRVMKSPPDKAVAYTVVVVVVCLVIGAVASTLLVLFGVSGGLRMY